MTTEIPPDEQCPARAGEAVADDALVLRARVKRIANIRRIAGIWVQRDDIRADAMAAQEPSIWGEGLRPAVVPLEPMKMTFDIECEREDDGRWIADATQLAGVMAYGDSKSAAVAKAQALALRVIADRIEHGEICSPTIAITMSTKA